MADPIPITVSCPIDKLPIELLSNIMEFLDICMVGRCMRVSMRWETAARSVIKTRSSLILFNGRVRQAPDGEFEKYSQNRINCRLCPAFAISMANLKVLFVGDIVDGDDAIDQLIGNNSHTLMIVSIPRGFPNGGKQFPCLNKLDCSSISPNAVANCHSLTHLTTWAQWSVEAFHHISNKHLMQAIDCKFGMFHKLDMETGIMELVKGLRQLTNLRKLRLCVQSVDWTDPGDWLNKLFDNFCKLTDVKIDVNNEEINLDDGVAIMAANNPSLQYLKLRGITLSDTALQSLSRLRNLRKVILDTEMAEYSMDAILTFLRGPSRSVFQKVSIWHQPESDWSRIEAEINLMSEERGEAFTVTQGGDWITFKA